MQKFRQFFRDLVVSPGKDKDILDQHVLGADQLQDLGKVLA
jgi:hypothetical protein